MNTEFEVKFVGTSHDAVRQKLNNLGGNLEQPMRLMRRAIIETPELKKKDAFLRVRDEGDSEQHVRDISKKMGFDWKDAVFGDVMAAYRMQYPHLSEQDTVGNIPEVRFSDPLPEMLKSK